jgi:hypothetical protein
MTDPDGHELIPPRIPDPLRHKPVWAAYKFRKDLHCAEARSSEFLDLATAKATADALNSNRGAGEGYCFKIYRVAALRPDQR